MQVRVFLFLCRAEFSGRSEIPYAQEPEHGAEHDCILFLSQQSDIPDPDLARAAFAKHGWINVHIKRVGPFQPENVNSAQWSAFQHNYQECLDLGDSVAWYA